MLKRMKIGKVNQLDVDNKKDQHIWYKTGLMTQSKDNSILQGTKTETSKLCYVLSYKLKTVVHVANGAWCKGYVST